MSAPRGRSPGHSRQRSLQDESFLSVCRLNVLVLLLTLAVYPQTRQLELFGRTLNATASHLIAGTDVSSQYRNALGEIHRELRKPTVQKSVFALAKASPRELVRSRFSSTEIQHRALAHVPDELLRDMPVRTSPYSLFQGFEATRPEDNPPGDARKKKNRLMLESKGTTEPHKKLAKLQTDHHRLTHRLDMMTIRKSMCSSEIKEIDKKLANLQAMRRTVVDRLADLEREEIHLEHELAGAGAKVDEAQEAIGDFVSPTSLDTSPPSATDSHQHQDSPSFMSESVYQKLPSPKSTKKRKNPRRISMPILHEHLEPGTRIRQFQAHDDTITAMDFDVPFGTMVTAALDDTLRVWDLNTGHCMGMLEGHLSSVRCIQVDDKIVASGSNDATVRLWDLGQAEYTLPQPDSSIHKTPTENEKDDAADVFTTAATEQPVSISSLLDCPLYTLSSHVAEVTALHFQGDTLVSGSSDKTLRQWDLETGRCVQTLDVLWAAAQASATTPSFASNNASSSPTPATVGGMDSWYRPSSGRISATEADFVGALQTFQSAVACGTADSVVRLWDLRSGMVQRSLIGHTGPITALQFDDVHLVTGSLDRSIRIWDLRTGSIYDAFAYEEPVTAMMFDSRRICSAAGGHGVRVYDKADGHQWDCGLGSPTDTQSTIDTVQRLRIKDGYMLSGSTRGIINVFAC